MVLCESLLFYGLDVKKDLPGTVGRSRPEKQPSRTQSTLVIFDHQENPQSSSGLSIRLQASGWMRRPSHSSPRKQITVFSEHPGTALCPLRCSEASHATDVGPAENDSVTTSRLPANPLTLSNPGKGEGIIRAQRTSSGTWKSCIRRTRSIPSGLVVQMRRGSVASSTIKSSLSEVSVQPSLCALS